MNTDVYLRPGLTPPTDVELYASATADGRPPAPGPGGSFGTIGRPYVAPPERLPKVYVVHLSVTATATAVAAASLQPSYDGRRRREDELLLVGAL